MHHRVVKKSSQQITPCFSHSHFRAINHGRGIKTPVSAETGRPSCSCHRSLLPLCRVIPTQSFGDSYFTAPCIVLLRLMFSASPFQLNCRHSKCGRRSAQLGDFSVGARFSTSVLKPRRLAREQRDLSLLSHLGRKLSTVDFLREVRSSVNQYSKYRVTSVSWVKALGSYMSHEFVQFVIEDAGTGHRRRLITDRQETGDWVIIPESDVQSASGTLWPKLSPYKDRHHLPLPLVSRRLKHCSSRPGLLDIAQLLVKITNHAPSYNPIREHCWWYAEVVFETLHTQYPSGTLKEWPWAKYRYAFVLCNSWIRRRTLAAHALDFERQCMEKLLY